MESFEIDPLLSRTSIVLEIDEQSQSSLSERKSTHVLVLFQ